MSSRRKTILLAVLTIVPVGLITAVGLLSYYLSEQFLFPFNWHNRPKEPHCSRWLSEEAFRDQSKQKKLGPHLNDLSCEAVLSSWQPKSRFLTSTNGLQVRLVQFEHSGSPKRPIWLHVHGVTGDYLHAARYQDFAQRIDVQLMALEYRNHGRSDRDGLGAGWGCKEKWDLITALTDLHAAFPDNEFLLSSTSMGTMTVALGMREFQKSRPEHRVRAVLFESPITSVADLTRYTSEAPPLPAFLLTLGLQVSAWRARLDLTADECSPKQALKGLTVPALVHSSSLDRITPTALVERFVEAIPADQLIAWKHYAKGYHSTVWNGQNKQFEQDIEEVFAEQFTNF